MFKKISFVPQEADVLDYWSYCGEVESLDMMRFPDTGRFKGIAFITFRTVSRRMQKSRHEQVSSDDRGFISDSHDIPFCRRKAILLPWSVMG